MNYACMTNQKFSTKKNLMEKKVISKEVESRKNFIKSHNFSVQINPSTNMAEVKVTKKSYE